MFKKLFTFAVLPLLAISSFLSAEVQYDIHDIDTLQTHSSHAIALNNQGQILGWYNIDGSKEGKHFFLRDRDGSFHEVPGRENGVGWEINWRYLTDNGSAYGTFDGNANYAVIYVWDEKNGVVKLGNLPGKEISAINNAGQVLIKSVKESENGRQIIHPVIWHNNQITKLKGLEGDLGIESEESYGLDMNNKGEVVGQSLTSLVYKNNVYYQTHAVKWVNGQAIDLHNTVPKTDKTIAKLINDLGEVIVGSYLVDEDGNLLRTFNSPTSKTNTNYFYNKDTVFDKSHNTVTSRGHIINMMLEDRDSVWLRATKIISVNDNGEIIAEGKTIFGENHPIFLTPSKNP